MASASVLEELSRELVQAAERAAAAVVRVDGGRRWAASGVALEAGLVATASHGLDADEALTVGLPSGETVPAELVGRDPATDLAVLRVPGPALPAPDWAAAEAGAAPAVGQPVLAVTRPGRGPRAALGVVSRVGDAWRTALGGKVDRYLELDLGLRPGFSGGLVVDLAGRPLGLATAGLVRGEPLALPAATVRRVAGALVAHGRVRRGWLGVATVPVRLPPAAARQLGQGTALLLTAVEEQSPAGQAGLALGDLLLALDGAPVADLSDLAPFLEEERIGAPARARLARGGEVRELTLTIGVRGGAEGRPA